VKLPPLHRPQDYVGLLVYDFGDHVSVGYTAEEIGILLSSPLHAGGTVYRVHRADEAGRIELQGMQAEHLDREEGLLFTFDDEPGARADYVALTRRAEADPLPCPAKLMLAELEAGGPAFAVVLSYPAFAAAAVSAWLSQATFEGGRSVDGGVAALTRFHAAGAATLDRCDLPTCQRFVTRSAAEVLAAVDRPVQR